MLKVYRLAGIILLVAAGLLTACSSSAATPEPDPVTVQLSWFHNIEFAGFYVADQKGYYREENLAVTLVPGGPEVDPTGQVLKGQAQFGVTTGGTIVKARAEGQDLVAVASIFRHNPLVVMTLAGSGIQQPEDLAEKTVGVISPNVDAPWDSQFLALLNVAGVDPATIDMVATQDYHGANEILSGRVQAASGFFWINEAVQAELEGHQTYSIFYSDYDILTYANPIFTTGQMIQARPDLVERFVRATLKGYRDAVENAHDAVELTRKFDDLTDEEFQREGMQAQIPFIDTGDAVIGWMDEGVWQNTQEVLLDQEIIASPVDLGALYTNDFVNKTGLQ